VHGIGMFLHSNCSYCTAGRLQWQLNVHRVMGAGLGALRHLDLSGCPSVHSFHLESVCYQCRPLFGCDTASQLLTQEALKETCSPYDTCCVASSTCYNLSSYLWLVSSIVIMAIYYFGIQARWC
jgi:hypothetical protein